MERLNIRRGRKLVLVSAPAGYGKTTLTSQWLSKTNAKYCWLSLDRNDNQSMRFWQYLLGSIQKQIPEIGQEASSFLYSETPHMEAAVTAIINDLNEWAVNDESFSIVLDDFHHIEDKECLNQFAYFIDFLPPAVQVIITTRYEPALPISRWSVKNWVDQIHSNDLVFSLEEAKAFLTDYMALELSDSQIETIFTRTEGWIAALQLAALSANSTPKSEQINISVERLLADDRHLGEYIVTEILSQQSEPCFRVSFIYILPIETKCQALQRDLGD